MKKINVYVIACLCAFMALMAAACAPSAAAPASATPTTRQTFTDPFAYCAAVGTLDAPDARYTGEKVPDGVIQGYKTAAGLENSTEPLEMFKKTTSWRCMNHQVYACNVGANLPCDSKANTSETASQAMVDFCKANQAADAIPMSVTGHDTIFNWRCKDGAPERLEQIDKVDAAGYLERIWYKIESKK